MTSETLDWREQLLKGRLRERLAVFEAYAAEVVQASALVYERVLYSPMDRRVEVRAAFESSPKSMIMLGSNNYLGLANDPRVKEAVASAIGRYGNGVAGPALLNGTSCLHRELEETLAALKGHEDVCLFASGYQANLAIVQALVTPSDLVIYDEKSHASLIRGLRSLMDNRRSVSPVRFAHNSIEDLRRRLEQAKGDGEIFVACEGVYSMEGDVADLRAVDRLRQEFGFHLVLDDAHGLGVLGEGRGAEHEFGVKADISMGTFSKAMAMTGGFVAGDRALVRYLRYFGEAGVFTASLPLSTVAAVLEGLKILQEEPERVERLHHNSRTLQRLLEQIGYSVLSGESAILSLPLPERIDIRQFNLSCHQKGLFINSVEPPAVPASKQLLRISMTSAHTEEDLNEAADILRKVGREFHYV